MTDTRIGLYGTAATCEALRESLSSCEGALCVSSASSDEHGWQSLLARDDLDAIMMEASPSGDVSGKVTQVLQSGIHLYIVGDAARTLEDVIAIRHAEAMTANLVLKVSALHRQHASVKAAKRIVETGELGELLFIRGVFGDEGQGETNGALMRLGMPMLDLVQMFAGPVEEVKSLVTGNGADCNAMALLRTHADVMTTIHASSTQWRRTFRLEIGFSGGYIWLDGLHGSDYVFGPEMLISANIHIAENGRIKNNPDEAIQEFPKQDTLVFDIAEFVHAVRTGSPLRTGTTTQLFDAMNVVQRIYAGDLSYDTDAIEA